MPHVQCPASVPLTVLDPRGDTPREKCGVFGVWGAPQPAHDTYLGLFALQHRGQESAGLAATNGAGLERVTGMGLVSQVFSEDKLAELDAFAGSGLAGGGAIGHNRYSTTGASRPENAQPFLGAYVGGAVAIAHNGNLVNARDLRDRLSQEGRAFATSTDTEVVLSLLASHSAGHNRRALEDTLCELRGAFSFVLLFEDRIEAARDPWGWRPLVLGRKPDGALIVASETVALDVVGATLEREVEPGEIVTLSDAGVASRRFAKPAAPLARCVFEHVYFASPASRVFGASVEAVRERLGATLAREAPADADMVSPMPDSGRSAATGFAGVSKMPYREAIIPNRYVGRTFIKPTGAERAAAVRLKLNVIADVVKDKRLVIVDDSIVRGTTTRAKMDQIRGAGAKEIHLRISCPPIKHPCYFGVDFPDREELVAHTRSVEEIRQLLGVDSLAYLSLDGLLDVVAARNGGAREDYCTACYSGDYPIEVDGSFTKSGLARAPQGA
jgi:amidophosphoribosyltransferase